MKRLLICATLALLAGCTLPLRPGHSELLTSSGATAQVVQSQNPKTATHQIYKRTESTPTGKSVTETVDTTIGAAQKDVARELGAKLSALAPVMWVGIAVAIFGASSFVWPITKAIVGGSVTTSAVITGAGVAMIALPVLLVGHELLILCVAIGAASFWFFAHRHGGIHAELKLLKEKAVAVVQNLEK